MTNYQTLADMHKYSGGKV